MLRQWATQIGIKAYIRLIISAKSAVLADAVVLSNSVLISLSMYVSPRTFTAANGWSGRAIGCRLMRTAILLVYMLRFPVHCVGVTNMFPRYKLMTNLGYLLSCNASLRLGQHRIILLADRAAQTFDAAL